MLAKMDKMESYLLMVPIILKQTLENILLIAVLNLMFLDVAIPIDFN